MQLAKVLPQVGLLYRVALDKRLPFLHPRRHADAVREYTALLHETLGQSWLSQRERERAERGG